MCAKSPVLCIELQCENVAFCWRMSNEVAGENAHHKYYNCGSFTCSKLSMNRYVLLFCDAIKTIASVNLHSNLHLHVELRIMIIAPNL